jgi:hypothetical protein
MTNDKNTPPAADKPARRRKNPEEKLAELDQKRKQLEVDAAEVKARAQLERAIAALRNGQNFDGAVEAAQHACRLMQPFVAVPDIDVEEYGERNG